METVTLRNDSMNKAWGLSEFRTVYGKRIPIETIVHVYTDTGDRLIIGTVSDIEAVIGDMWIITISVDTRWIRG